MKVAFSLNMYDEDGDKLESGIMLHIGDSVILKLENIESLQDFVNDVNLCLKQAREELGGKANEQTANSI